MTLVSGSTSTLGMVVTAPMTPEPDLSNVVGARNAVLALATRWRESSARKMSPTLPVTFWSSPDSWRANAADCVGVSPSAGLASISVRTRS